MVCRTRTRPGRLPRAIPIDRRRTRSALVAWQSANPIADMNRHHPAFTAHDGDLKTGNGAPICGNSLYDTALTWFNSLEACMRTRFSTTARACALAILWMAPAAFAQTPAQGAAAAPVSTSVAAPTYVSIPMEIAVNRPAADVWKRVGKFCDIGEWLRIPCTITAGRDGEFGAVRSV